jgi:glutathione S-transferase
MKLFTSPTSPYARKARVIIYEHGIDKMVEEIQTNPATSEELHRINPLGKIPTLVLDDGSVLFDSPVICEYLDELGGGKFFPGKSMWRTTSGRWRALTLQALGDGIADAAVARVREGRRPEGAKNSEVVANSMAAIVRSLDVLERAGFRESPTIGEIAVACAIGYLDFRLPDTAWRDTRPKLREWYEEFVIYPSMKATHPTEPT